MSQSRSTAIVNAVVRTVDDYDSVANAILFRDAKIIAVGLEQQVRAAAEPDTEFIDVGGRTIVPGFIDSHNHLSTAAFTPEYIDCSTPPLNNIDELMSAIEAHCQTIPRHRWVIGMGFSSSHVSEQRYPTRHELDQVAPHNPLLLIDSSVHAGYANSRALAAVGISAHTPQPWGGEIAKGHNGEPTGALFEAGLNLLMSASWDSYAQRDWDRAVQMLSQKMRDYLAAGITGVGDAGVTSTGAELYRRADIGGMLPFTVQQLHVGSHLFARQDLAHADVIGRIKEPESERLRGGTMKIFVDRVFPDGPAIDKMHDSCTRHVGTRFYSEEEVLELAVGAGKLGIGTAMHAMGNCAMESVIHAYEAVRRVHSSPVLRLEHAFVADVKHGKRMAELGVDLIANPGLILTRGKKFSLWRGADQPQLKVLPVRSMLDAGVRVSFASDYPCATYLPAQVMWSAVTRKTIDGDLVDPDEAVTAAEALRLYTINAAYASSRAAEEGSLEVGKRANLVVLDRDIVTCPPDDIRDMRVDMTFVDGQLVYERD